MSSVFCAGLELPDSEPSVVAVGGCFFHLKNGVSLNVNQTLPAQRKKLRKPKH